MMQNSTKTNRLAVISFVSGVTPLVIWALNFIIPIPGTYPGIYLDLVFVLCILFPPPIALITGIIAIRQLAKKGGTGRGLAWAGAIIGAALLVLFIPLFLICAMGFCT